MPDSFFEPTIKGTVSLKCLECDTFLLGILRPAMVLQFLMMLKVTPWSRVPLDKAVVPQTVKTFLEFTETQFSTPCMRARHLSPPPYRFPED